MRWKTSLHTTVVLLHLVFIPTVQASTGAELLRNCTTALRLATDPNFVPNLFEATTCVSYLEGILETISLYQKLLPREKWIVCIPGGIRRIPLSEYARIVVDFLQANPGRLKEPQYNLVLGALKEAFPCFSS